LVASLNASFRNQESTITNHRRALDEVYNPALKMGSDIDAYLFEPTPIGDLQKPKTLRLDGEKHLVGLNPVMEAAPVIGTITAIPSVMALTSIATEIVRVISISDDTIAPVKCILGGDVIHKRPTEGVSTSLIIQVTNKNGANITRGGASMTVCITPTNLADSTLPLTPSEVKVNDNYNGTYTANWICGPPGDYNILVKLGPWTILGGGVRPFRVYALQKSIRGNFLFKIGSLGPSPGNNCPPNVTLPLHIH
jgi:hypothetical protein